MDGDEAAATSSYPFLECSFLYPITPATAAAEHVEAWAAQGRKNLFGNIPEMREMQAEGGVAGAMHGAAIVGTLGATYTCSQGLLLMIPNMYKMAYEMLPCVIHVASRLVAHHAMSLYCDYSDVFACRDTGFAMLASSDPQECLDLGTIAHLVSCKQQVSFLHFFDGLRTSHSIQKIELIPEQILRELFPWESVQKWKETKAMSTEHPTMRGCGQNDDIFWSCSEGTAPIFRNIPNQVNEMMRLFGDKVGRHYHIVDYYGASDAEDVVLIMGSGANTTIEVVQYLNQQTQSYKVGVLKLRLYRPFPSAEIVALIPPTCKRLCVLDRAKQVTAPGEPLYLELLAAINSEKPELFGQLRVLSCKVGVGGYNIYPNHILAVFQNMKSDKPLNRCSVGINDDISHNSLLIPPSFNATPSGTVQAKFFGLGADGTVGSCKEAIKLIGESTDLYTQGYFVFDAKKTGGFTFSHLRFGREAILSEYDIFQGDYIAVHHHSFLKKFNVTDALKDGSIFVLNCPWDTQADIEENVPAYVKKAIATNNAKFYYINAFSLAEKIGLKGHINMIMSVCFFSLAKVIPVEQAIELLKNSVRHMYSKKGDAVIKQNVDAIDSALQALHNYQYEKEQWIASSEERKSGIERDEQKNTSESGKEIDMSSGSQQFYDTICNPILRQEAHLMPVSALLPISRGIFPSGTSKYEKRSVAASVPLWDKDNCVQCNICSFVCPHAAIRPFIFDKVTDSSPDTFIGIGLNGAPKKDEDDKTKQWLFRIQVSPRDCLGCGLCVSECPKKCLKLRPFGLTDADEEDINWKFATSLPKERGIEVFPKKIKKVDEIESTSIIPNAKDTQFRQPLLEFNGACAGCTQPIHMKIITQMFGGELFIANAVGCSMIWGGYTPTSPYTTDSEGVGPVYATSLFEDNAEFGLGVSVGVRKRRSMLKSALHEYIALPSEKTTPSLKTVIQELLDNFEDLELSKEASRKVKKELNSLVSSRQEDIGPLSYIYHNRDLLANKIIWVNGGDGWAYDIDFHGLDHLLHSGEDVNIVIFDTEVYSNTGGQASKATPRGASAKLATNGKRGPKKDFGVYAMNSGVCYVASTCIGANRAQFIRSVSEAVAFKGPSVIITYCPCIAHNIKQGLVNGHEQQRLAVQGGYWPLYRFNPALISLGKNPLTLDIDPISTINEAGKVKLNQFLCNELRFNTPGRTTNAEILQQIQKDVEDKNRRLKKMLDVWAPSDI